MRASISFYIAAVFASALLAMVATAASTDPSIHAIDYNSRCIAVPTGGKKGGIKSLIPNFKKPENCRRLECTLEIVPGHISPSKIKQQIINDAIASTTYTKAQNYGANGPESVFVSYSDGAAAENNDLYVPDAAHPGKWWAKMHIWRASNFNFPDKPDGTDAIDLKNVRNVLRASLRYCKSVEKVKCCADAYRGPNIGQ